MTTPSYHVSRSNTSEPPSIPFSSSMSSTTSSLSQYSIQQPKLHAPSDFPSGSASPITPGSLPERESSLRLGPDFTPADEEDKPTPQPPSGPQLQKIAHSERERDLRRVSSESAESDDTYGGNRGESKNNDPNTPTIASMIGGQNIKQENMPSRLGGVGSLATAESSGTRVPQSQPKVGNPGGTPLFDLSAATFNGPSIDLSETSTSQGPAQRIPYPKSSSTSPVPPFQSPQTLSTSPAATSGSMANDYLTAASSANRGGMTQMGMGTGLGIGMPQGVPSPGSFGEGRMTFDEGLLRTLCDLDVSRPLHKRRGRIVVVRY